jgi:hypothetical protein
VEEKMKPAAADSSSEITVLRSLFKELEAKPNPREVSSALGKYARFLSRTRDDRTQLAEEYFNLALHSEDPCPESVHTYFWYRCTRLRDFRSIPQYELIRTRFPDPNFDADAAIAKMRSAQTEYPDPDAVACLANFLHEICHLDDRAEMLFSEAFRDDASTTSGRLAFRPSAFAQGKYAHFLAEARPEKASEARALFDEALDADPGNVEGMIDFARFLAGGANAEDMETARTLCLRALEALPADARVLGNYAHFLDLHTEEVLSNEYVRTKSGSEHPRREKRNTIRGTDAITRFDLNKKVEWCVGWTRELGAVRERWE